MGFAPVILTLSYGIHMEAPLETGLILSSSEASVGDKTVKAVFRGRLTGVGVIGEIPQGESLDEQDEQEQGLGMLAFNSPGEETGQEGSRGQEAREVSEVRGESGEGQEVCPRHTRSTVRTFYKRTTDQRQRRAAPLCHLRSDRQFPRGPGLMTFPDTAYCHPLLPQHLQGSGCLSARPSLLAYCNQPSEAGRRCWGLLSPLRFVLPAWVSLELPELPSFCPFPGPAGPRCLLSHLSPVQPLGCPGRWRSPLVSPFCSIKVVPVS